MGFARLVLWEAWDPALELIRLEFGDAVRPSIALEKFQTEPGSSWLDNIYPSDRPKLREFLNAPDVMRAKRFVDYRLIVADGELLWIRQWLLERGPLEQERRRLVGLLMPIAEQKHLEWECLRVSERECNRIGQELHDDVCQMLAGLTFIMHVVGQRVAKAAPDLGADMKDLNGQLQAATDRVRAMAHGLFPAQLNHSNLRETLTQLARQSRMRFSLQLELELPKRIPTHSPTDCVHIYRIAQEAVSNAVRHGAATTIRLVLQASAQSQQLDIEDDGKGFPSSALRPEGIGMHVMQYRARILGGTVTFKNRTPRGAVVQLKYPTPNQRASERTSTP